MNRTAPSPSIVFAVAVLGIATFSIMDAAVKGATLAIGVYNALLWRGVAILGIAAAVHFVRRPRWPSRAAMRLHFERGMVAVVMSLTFFWGLARVPMAQAVSLAYVAPLLAIFLAALMLDERVGRASLYGSALAMLGVGVILYGQAHADLGAQAGWGTLAIFASAVSYAYNLVLARRQSQLADPAEITFWQSLFVLAGFLVAAPWLAVVPPVVELPRIGLAAVLATVSLMLLAWAYRHGEASFLAPSEYSSFVWAALLGWLVFGERLMLTTVAGAVLIIAGCLYAARVKPITAEHSLETGL